MRMPWSKSRADQLTLLDAVAEEQVAAPALGDDRQAGVRDAAVSTASDPIIARVDERPLVVPVDRLCEDPNNPRTEFPDGELDELADDIRARGILQPLVVHPIGIDGRYRLHFGAKRLRAALRAGLQQVPVTIRDAPADPYANVAENQKRHGLTPLDLARFIRGRVDAGESNAEVARRLGMNLTSVAHHLTLLELPPSLDEALKSRRCMSPRTLHELSKLHEEQPQKVAALVAGNAEITRAAVSALRAKATDGPPATSPSARLISRANAACDRLERTLDRIKPSEHSVATADLVALRVRVADLACMFHRSSAVRLRRGR